MEDTRLPLAIENLYYNGCRITSDSLTTDSPDTPDGGPVVEITTVDPNVIVFNGSSDNDEAIALSEGNTTEVRTIPTSVLVSNKKKPQRIKAFNKKISKINEFRATKPVNFIPRRTKAKLPIRRNVAADILKTVDRMFKRFRR